MIRSTVSDIIRTLQATDSNAFYLALTQAAASMANPAYGNRLRLAKDLVQRGAVTLHDDGTATVTSDNYTYEIVGACPCDESRRRSPYCQHVLAVQLLKRTIERLRQGLNGSVTPPPARSQAWAVREAPASCCLKFKIDSIEVMYTMRDVDDSALFPRVRRVLARLQDKIGPTGSHAVSQNGASQTPPHPDEAPRRQRDTGAQGSHPLADGARCQGK